VAQVLTAEKMLEEEVLKWGGGGGGGLGFGRIPGRNHVWAFLFLTIKVWASFSGIP